MQLAAVAFGVIWITSRLQASRIKELEQMLDSETDAIEDALVIGDERVVFNLKSETVRELYSNRNFYFSLTGADGTTLEESRGPSLETRAALRTLLASQHQQDEQVVGIDVGGTPWRVVRERLSLKTLAKMTPELALPRNAQSVFLNVATNAGPTMTELRLVRRYMVVGAVLLVSLISFGTSIIVSHTTSNLRAMAHSLRNVKPQNPVWTPPGRPQCAEELLLFESFRSMLSAIKKSTDAQRLFIADASHELKTPVAGMLTTLQVMLAKRRSPEEYEQMGRDLLNAVQGLRRLSGTLLDLARLENQAEIETSILNVEDLLATVSDRWVPVAERKGVVLTFANAPGLMVHGNRELLEVAVGNFIDNAIKYSDSGDSVEITAVASHGGKGMILHIDDHGVGMNERDLSHLGEVFFRSDEARSDDMSYGLGFAQAQRIVGLLGGHVEVKSKLGHGTEIIVTICS